MASFFRASISLPVMFGVEVLILTVFVLFGSFRSTAVTVNSRFSFSSKDTEYLNKRANFLGRYLQLSVALLDLSCIL